MNVVELKLCSVYLSLSIVLLYYKHMRPFEICHNEIVKNCVSY